MQNSNTTYIGQNGKTYQQIEVDPSTIINSINNRIANLQSQIDAAQAELADIQQAQADAAKGAVAQAPSN